MSKQIECECGKVTGEKCQWTGPIEETVIVEYMPDSLRDSHEAAGNRGIYPAKSCADLIVKTNDGWAQIH